MGWPQITYIVLVAMSLGLTMAKHGQPRTDNHNAWTSLLALAIVMPLLYFGGFFS